MDGERLIGCITTRQVQKIPRERWNATTAGELAEACSAENTIVPDTDAVKALSGMYRTGAGRLMVVKGDRLLGIIALKDLLNFLSLKIELEEG
ncbi:MAG: CBS domain-containing protein [Desulfobacterales bacterium]